MPAFQVEFAPAAQRDLKGLDPPVQVELLKAAAVLTQNPFPSLGKRILPLVGIVPRHFRLRIGDYRLVYRIEVNKVIVVRVAHRREAYRADLLV